MKEGDKLLEQGLSERFGVSRGPVHDVLLQLTQGGLLDANVTLGSDYASWGKQTLPLDWMTTWGSAMGEAHRRDPELKERFKQIQIK